MKRALYMLIGLGLSAFSQASQPPALSGFNHQSAFALPLMKINNTDYVLLGREAGGADRGTFDAFGGKRDPGDGAHPLETAAREFYEEGITSHTLGMNMYQVRTFMHGRSGNTRFIFAVTTNRGRGRHVLYLTSFPYRKIQTLIQRFPLVRRAQRNSSFRGKDGLVLVKLSDLLQAIVTTTSNTGVQVTAQVTDLQGNRTARRITVRPILVKLLRGYAEKKNFRAGRNSTIRFY